MAKGASHGREGHTCCGILEEAHARSVERREKRRDEPLPWIALKVAVGITVCIIAYAFYVYIGRFCVPMIRGNTGVLGGRRIGSEYYDKFPIVVRKLMVFWY